MSETHARREATKSTGALSRGSGGTDIGIKKWADTRKAHRAKAAAETEALRQRILMEQAERSRKDALARGVPHYVGRPCSRHASGERFTADGSCVLCKYEKDRRERGLPVIPVNLREPERTPRVSVYKNGFARMAPHAPSTAPLLETAAADDDTVNEVTK